MTTGGIGPTEDDLTREVIARITGRKAETIAPFLRKAMGAGLGLIEYTVLKVCGLGGSSPDGWRNGHGPGLAPGKIND
jgi:hypothetical protein